MAKQLLFNQTPSSGGGMGDGVVLWENPNPDVAFQGTTLLDYIDFSSYSFVCIKWKQDYSVDAEVKETIFKASDLTQEFAETEINGMVFGELLNGGYSRYRFIFGYQGVTMVSNALQVYGTAAAEYNTIIIPVQVIGYY